MLTFCTIADSTFMNTLVPNVKILRKLYPECEFIIGDIGLLSKDVHKLEKMGAEVFTGDTLESEDYGFKLLYKPLFMLKLVNRSNLMIFMDADCIMTKRINFMGLYDYDFPQAAVTVRESEHGRVNAGVVMVLNGQVAFMSDWIRRAAFKLISGVGKLSEQDALCEVVDSKIYNIGELPCSEYNYTTIEDGIPDDVHIVHLKSRRRFKQSNIELVKKHIEKTYGKIF